MSLLQLSGVTGGYGPVQVLHGLDLAVEEGQVVVVLGANGAGKTTTLRAISGVIHDRATSRSPATASPASRRSRSPVSASPTSPRGAARSPT